MQLDWQPLLTAIDTHERFVISGHVRPDADALGSALALAEVIRQRGTNENPKDVFIVNPSAAPLGLDFLVPDDAVHKVGPKALTERIERAEVHIVVDTSSWGQLQDLTKIIKNNSAELFVIDHHHDSGPEDCVGPPEATVIKDTTCEATGTLIFRFIDYAKGTITPQMATWLYAAIATDTGWFRFPSTTPETMRVIASLMEAGADPTAIYRDLYEQRTPERVTLAARVLSRLELAEDGRLAILSVSAEDFAETGARPADTEDLVNEGLRIKGVQASFIAVEQPGGRIKFSLRAREGGDVQQVASKFGGGGHRLASGATLPGPLSEALPQVRAAMEEMVRGE